METLFKLQIPVFEKVLNDIISHLYLNENVIDTDMDSEIILGAKQDIIRIITNNDFDEKEIINELQNKNWEHEKILYFAKLISSKKVELLYATLARHNSKYGDTVIDFDWYIKLILGTSELNNLKYPLLQLTLKTTDSNGHQDNLLMDTNKEILFKLINTLEIINNT